MSPENKMLRKQLVVEEMPAFFHNLRCSLLTAAGENINHTRWNVEFRNSNLLESIKRFEEYVVDFSQVPYDLAVTYFAFWDRKDNIETYLIPLYMYSILKPGQTLISLSGKRVIVGVDYKTHGAAGYIDRDHRQGSLAYGIIYDATSKTVSL